MIKYTNEKGEKFLIAQTPEEVELLNESKKARVLKNMSNVQLLIAYSKAVANGHYGILSEIEIADEILHRMK